MKRRLGILMILMILILNSIETSNVISKCADPFSLQTLMDMRLDMTESKDGIMDMNLVAFRSESSPDASQLVCEYQMYCTNHYVAPFEAYLGAKGGLDDELEEMEKQKAELKQTQEELETNMQQKKEAAQQLEKEEKEREEAQKKLEESTKSQNEANADLDKQAKEREEAKKALDKNRKQLEDAQKKVLEYKAKSDDFNNQKKQQQAIFDKTRVKYLNTKQKYDNQFRYYKSYKQTKEIYQSRYNSAVNELRVNQAKPGYKYPPKRYWWGRCYCFTCTCGYIYKIKKLLANQSRRNSINNSQIKVNKYSKLVSQNYQAQQTHYYAYKNIKPSYDKLNAQYSQDTKKLNELKSKYRDYKSKLDNNKNIVNRETKEVADTKARYGVESQQYKDAVDKLKSDTAALEQAKISLDKESQEADDAKKVLDKEQSETEQSQKDVQQNVEDVKQAEEAYRIAKNTCGSCKKEFQFNERMVPMVQSLRYKNNQYYIENQAIIYKSNYGGVFNDDMDDKPPGLQRVSCYIGFEKSSLVLLGDKYSDEIVGTPFDYLREAYLSGSDRDYKVIFDVVDNGSANFLPELHKIKSDSKSQCCMETCSVQDQYSYLLKIETMKEQFPDLVEVFDKTLEFQEQFNEEYLDRIHNFIKSTSTYFRIGEYCAKVVKLIRFVDFIQDKYRNLAVSGSLEDYYDGDNLITNKMGIYKGYHTDMIQTFITFDRQCMINKMFGRPMYQ